jgi:phage host-nuclease inhibitor protein Gam
MKASELKQQMDGRFASVDQQFADIRQDMDRRFTAVEARIGEEGRITRRHFDVVAEDLKQEIRTLAATVAEGQRTLDENRSEHQTFSAALGDHELRLIALEHRRRRKP